MKKKKTHGKTTDGKHTYNRNKLKYPRLILKVSGEIIGSRNALFEPKNLDYIVTQIVSAQNLGARIGVVVGGGNIIRGRDARWLNKVDADVCGMLATVINGVVIHSELQKHGVQTKLSSGIDIRGVVSRCNRFEETRFYERGCVLVFVGGTGNPLFTTDTAAALRAVEFGADIVVKATNVDGVYSADPNLNSAAKLYKKLSYDEAISKNLAVMDLAAFTICGESRIPIYVYNLMKYSLSDILKGKDVGTLVTCGGES